MWWFDIAMQCEMTTIKLIGTVIISNHWVPTIWLLNKWENSTFLKLCCDIYWVLSQGTASDWLTDGSSDTQARQDGDGDRRGWTESLEQQGQGIGEVFASRIMQNRVGLRGELPGKTEKVGSCRLETWERPRLFSSDPMFESKMEKREYTNFQETQPETGLVGCLFSPWGSWGRCCPLQWQTCAWLTSLWSRIRRMITKFFPLWGVRVQCFGISLRD